MSGSEVTSEPDVSSKSDAENSGGLRAFDTEASHFLSESESDSEDEAFASEERVSRTPEASPRVPPGGSAGECDSSRETTSSTSSSNETSVSSRVGETVCHEFVKETWIEHLRIHGPKHKCPQCRWVRNRQKWEAELTYQYENKHGSRRFARPSILGLGCKVCRWAKKDSVFSRGQVRTERGTQLRSLQRHGNHVAGRMCHAHAEAVEEARKASARVAGADPCEDAATSEAGPRDDVPSLALFYAAYKIAKKGASFQHYEADVKVMRAVGASLHKSRGSRFVAKNIVECVAEELRWEDAQLLSKCSDIALTMDGRKSMLVVRVRMTMGYGMPTGFRGESHGGAAQGGSTRREIRGVHGQYVHTVDRLIALRKERAFDDTPALAQHLVEAFKAACGSDEVWQRARRRVRVCCPDGAANEQLAARLASGDFENMKFVIRCGAHSVHGAVKNAWGCDARVKEVTELIQEVGKFLRHSSRFELRFGAKAREEVTAVVQNLDFAPQRFCSKERPLTRVVHFAHAIMLSLALEVTAPTSPERRKWAHTLLQKLNGPTWMLVGMLVDLSQDCNVFLRKFDEAQVDPLAFQSHLAHFFSHLITEYEKGGMWLRRQSTYSTKISDMLETTSTLSFECGYVVVSKPTKAEARENIATLANVAGALRIALESEFPSFSIQRLFSALELHGAVPEDPQIERLQQITKLLGWPEPMQNACVHEYRDAFAKAFQEKQRNKGLRDRDAWAKVVAVDKSKATLKKVVCMAIGFLITETECERNFAAERRAHDGRPRLTPDTRFYGLKVMLDGLSFERLQEDGVPVGDFWRKCQDRYAQKFGTRRMGDRAQRKDAGATRAGIRKRDGKDTVTAFKRARVEAISSQAVIPFGPQPGRTVFGHREMPRRKLEQLRQQQETDTYRELIDKMQTKLQKKTRRV